MTWVIILKNNFFLGREKEGGKKKENKRLSIAVYILVSTVSFSACASATLFRMASVAMERRLALGSSMRLADNFDE